MTDSVQFSKLARLIRNKNDLSEADLPKIEEIVDDSGKARLVLEAAKSSMGSDISDLDILNIQNFALRVIDLAEYRRRLHDYLLSKMSIVAPNLSALIGEMVGARLISHAGSLTNLAKCPASTVQILGAEKALFRALKSKGNTPKYGLIYHSSFIGKANSKDKGRISRYLANKCSIASRIDNFIDTPTNKFGEAMKRQVEERLDFFDHGSALSKNEVVMKGVVDSMVTENNLANESMKKKSRKSEPSSAITSPKKKEKREKKEKSKKEDNLDEPKKMKEKKKNLT